MHGRLVKYSLLVQRPAKDRSSVTQAGWHGSRCWPAAAALMPPVSRETAAAASPDSRGSSVSDSD